MSDLARVEFTTRNGVAVAVVRGEIDLSNADALLESLEQTTDGSAQDLVVDLTELDYLDSAGVRLFFKLAASVARHGGQLRAVVPADAAIRRVLELAHAETAFALDETDDAALRRLGT